MSELYLVHHGIKGQKWGIRRYQNEDGTLTDAGRKHMGLREKLADKAYTKDHDAWEYYSGLFGKKTPPSYEEYRSAIGKFNEASTSKMDYHDHLAFVNRCAAVGKNTVATVLGVGGLGGSAYAAIKLQSIPVAVAGSVATAALTLGVLESAKNNTREANTNKQMSKIEQTYMLNNSASKQGYKRFIDEYNNIKKLGISNHFTPVPEHNGRTYYSK